MTSARCVESGCTFVCVSCWSCWGANCFAKHTTVLSAQIKRQSCLMCWSSGVSVAVTWSALFCLKCTTVQVWKSIHRFLTMKMIRDPSQSVREGTNSIIGLPAISSSLINKCIIFGSRTKVILWSSVPRDCAFLYPPPHLIVIHKEWQRLEDSKYF